jgi:hypothetical protein
MKKILLSSAAAICAAIGFSSFKSAAFTTSYFKVTGSNVAKATGAKFNNSTVSYITSESGGDCSGSDYDCVVTFASADLTSGGEHLATSLINPSYQAAHTVVTKG